MAELAAQRAMALNRPVAAVGFVNGDSFAVMDFERRGGERWEDAGQVPFEHPPEED